MFETSTAVNPKPIISLMFAVSVGFWASELSAYFNSFSAAINIDLSFFNVQNVDCDLVALNQVPDKQREKLDTKLRAARKSEQPCKIDLSDMEVSAYDVRAVNWDRIEAGTINWKMLKESKLYLAANDSLARALREAVPEKFDKTIILSRASFLMTLGSGVLFLLDLLCIVWWYARYIYRIQPDASFGTYTLDFVICSMFALAANTWTDPRTFVISTGCASVFLGYRFWLLYIGSSASLTDRRILKRAGIALVAALSVAVVSLTLIDDFAPSSGIGLVDGLPGALSLIGILLTLYLWRDIDVAVDIYSAQNAPVMHAHLEWPRLGKLPDDSQRARIRNRAKAGLKAFDELFRGLGKHDRIHSRVHSETELCVQSYILAVSSCEKAEYSEEIEQKAFMVALSHWLDDLVDGRNEIEVWKRLRGHPGLSADPEGRGAENRMAEDLFRHIYRPLIIKHTDKDFYEQLHRRIREACLFSYNREYMFLGLNRVAIGSVIFSPKIPAEQRADILSDHNVFLKTWNVESSDFTKKVEQSIDTISRGGDAGAILLGLTTKTVQEVSMSSECERMNVGLSILLSILYAPLIYYHNIIQELKHGEMVPLQAFDTEIDLWIPWLHDVRSTIASCTNDRRIEARAQQAEMAFKCFEPLLPEKLRSELHPIYVK